MGHFGKGPIRWSWYVIVLPSLLLSYAGQTAYLIEQGSVTGNPFFQIAPAWSIYPLVGLATVATIIASQAIITGSFSMTRQAMQLGWLPGIAIRQTSDRVYGQIYVPAVNWLMMVATVGTTIGFGSSDRLAGAYGTAVATTMLLTTCLLYKAMRDVWRWPATVALVVGGLFVVVDSSFFAANLLKIADGGWLPLSLAALLFSVMVTWRSGVDALRASTQQSLQAAEQFQSDLANGLIPRIDGTTVFLTRGSHKIPQFLVDYTRFVGALPRHSITLSVEFANTPRIDGPRCTAVEKVADGLWHVVVRFGFVEIPDIQAALRQTQGLDAAVDFNDAKFVGTRDLVVHKPGSRIFSRWRLELFAFLFRNAAKVVDRFNLPPHNVLEIARQIEI
jgi:KUP system potassium uptake protein